eukprot:4601636-Amphidinium_carterae.1
MLLSFFKVFAIELICNTTMFEWQALPEHTHAARAFELLNSYCQSNVFRWHEVVEMSLECIETLQKDSQGVNNMQQQPSRCKDWRSH